MIGLALRQLWREPRVTGVLLAAIALVTSFAALAPLYVRMVSAAELDVRMTTLVPRQQRLELTSETPLSADVLSPIKAELGETIRSTHRFAYAPSRFCRLSPVEPPFPVYVPCYRQYTYPDLAAEFVVIEGRLPQPNDAVMEVALTTAALERSAQLDREFQFVVGGRYLLGASEVPSHEIELVGIVQSIVPEADAHWDGQTSVFGAIIPSDGNRPDELDLGLLVHPDVLPTGYDTSGARLYVARANLELTTIRAAELDALGRKLDAALTTVRNQNPTISVLSPISVLIADFQARLAEVGKPVLLLVALTLVLLLYTLITTGALILDRARTAWAQMAGRGGSARQLVLLHAAGMAALGVLAWLMSVPLALGFAVALAALGPQAGVIQYPLVTDLPTESVVFGGAAALLAVAALVLPGIPAAFTSFARLKSESGRPAARPLWARYYADVILTGLGLAFVLRARGSADLSDPFSLAGPALLLTGTAMLWLRAFPLLMRGAGAALGTLNRFGVRLAFWGLERDPGSSGQLVMLVVGALALGTASLALSQTRAESAWDAALSVTAADVLLVLDPAQADATFDYTQLPGVTAAQSRVVVVAGGPPGRLQAILIGHVDPDAPELAPLADADYTFAGVAIPDDAEHLALDVFSEASDPPTAARVSLEIANGDHLHVQLPLTTSDDTVSGQWRTYSAALDPAILGRGPYRLTGLLFPSLRPEERSRFGAAGRFDHTMNLAELRAETPGGAVKLADLTGDVEAILTRPVERADVRSSVLTFDVDDEILTPGGEPSMRVLYNRNSIIPNRAPVLNLLAAQAPIPVLVTEAFARAVGDRSALRRPLQIGDALPSEFPDPASPFQRLRVEYVVVDIVVPPTPYPPTQSMLLTRADWLQSQLNRRRATLETGTGINRVRLTMIDRQPSPELRAALAALPGVQLADFAYDRFAALQRAPLANAVTGMLFAGFCAAFGLIVLQAGFYTAVTLRRRAGSFAVLRSLGWGTSHVLRMLAIEQAAVVLPALVIGVLVGTVLAALLLPLLGVQAVALSVPLAQVAGLLVTIGVLFVALLAWSANMLRGADVAQQVRIVE